MLPRPVLRWLITVLGLALVLVAGDAFAGDAGAFVLKIPDGWVDISPGTPAANLERVTPDVRKAAEGVHQNPEALLYAAAPNADVVMFATLRPESSSEPLDDAALLRASNDLGWHDHLVVEQRRLETVDGLAWGRFTGHTDNGKRFLTFLVPGRPRSLFILFVAPPESFDALVPTFEQAARATRGAEQPIPKSSLPLGFPVIIGLGVMVWLLNRARAKRQRTAPADRRSEPEK